MVLDTISRCHQHGIGVLVDFHALPGGANGDSHSGVSTGKAELWSHKHNLDLALECLRFLAVELRPLPNITGLQLVNEAQWAAPGMFKFYDNAIDLIASIDPTIPIYISDGWNLNEAITYCRQKNNVNTSLMRNPVIIDTHKYFTFTEKDRAKSPQEIIQEVRNSQLSELNPHTTKAGNVFDNSTAIGVFIGEYSVTLDGRTWSRTPSAASNRKDLTRQFGHAQSELYINKAIGCTFWSYKFDWEGHQPGRRGMVHTGGGDWGFRTQVDNGNIFAPRVMVVTRGEIGSGVQRATRQARQGRRDKAVGEQTGYWSQTTPGGEFKYDLYGHGWDLGWDDADAFFSSRFHGRIPVTKFNGMGDGDWLGGDFIGALDLWVMKRMAECGMQKQREKCGWGWEQGFRRGLADFREVAGC